MTAHTLTGRSTTRTSVRPLGPAEIAIIAALACALVIAVLARPDSAHTESLPTTDIRVDAGQSLWSIASAHPVAGLDTAQTADLISTLNGLEGSMVRTGDVLKVPSSASEDVAVALR